MNQIADDGPIEDDNLTWWCAWCGADLPDGHLTGERSYGPHCNLVCRAAHRDDELRRRIASRRRSRPATVGAAP